MRRETAQTCSEEFFSAEAFMRRWRCRYVRARSVRRQGRQGMRVRVARRHERQRSRCMARKKWHEEWRRCGRAQVLRKKSGARRRRLQEGSRQQEAIVDSSALLCAVVGSVENCPITRPEEAQRSVAAPV